MEKIFSIEDVQLGTKGKILSSHARHFSEMGTDTRKDLSGKIFFALRGENHDAHQFLTKAVEAGAALLVIDKETPELAALQAKVSVIKVEDTLKALQSFGTYWRKKLGIRIVALTGSNGKTTTKEFAAALLKQKWQTHFSHGSYNNHFGVPMSLLELRAHHQMGVIEMGMNHAGEITELVKVADPDTVVVTMVGRAHIEHFGTIDKIALAKAEIYEAARSDCQRIFNLDNSWTRKMWEKWRDHKCKQWTYSSEDAKADIFLRLKQISTEGLTIEGTIAGVRGEAKVPVFGVQNLTNLMAAAGLALAEGVSPEQIWRGFADCRTIWGRNQFVDLKCGAKLLFDAYNANPDSMKALLENLPYMKGYQRRIGVFGEMLEMGDLSASAHEELGYLAGQSAFDYLWFVGSRTAEFAAGAKRSGYSKKLVLSNTYEEKLASELASMLNHQDFVVVKGSRGIKLERIVEALSPLNLGKK